MWTEAIVVSVCVVLFVVVCCVVSKYLSKGKVVIESSPEDKDEGLQERSSDKVAKAVVSGVVLNTFLRR